jgi:hypothetical protein
LAVLSALVDRLETVTVWIENVRSVITGIVIQARAGLAVVGRAPRHCCLVERVHLGLALGDQADMRSPGVRIALPEPEEYAAVPSEALEVGMSFGAILAVVIDGMHDAERLESHLVKGNRSIEILDGYEDVVEQEFTSFVSRAQPAFAAAPRGERHGDN